MVSLNKSRKEHDTDLHYNSMGRFIKQCHSIMMIMLMNRQFDFNRFNEITAVKSNEIQTEKTII